MWKNSVAVWCQDHRPEEVLHREKGFLHYRSETLTYVSRDVQDRVSICHVLTSLQSAGMSQREFAHLKNVNQGKKNSSVMLGCFVSVFWPFASVSVILYALSSQEHIALISDKDCSCFMIQIVHLYFFIISGPGNLPVKPITCSLC